MRNVEDIYPLSPMQQGMLFHSLYESETGQYIIQMRCTHIRGSQLHHLDGPLRISGAGRGL